MVSTLVSIYFDSPRLWHTVKTNFIKCLTLNSDIYSILEKGLGLDSPPYFAYDSSRKIFPKLYSTNRPNVIISLLLLFETPSNICNVNICFPVYDVINLILALAFYSSCFSTWPKSQDKKLKLKTFSIFFTGLSVARMISDLRVGL